MRYNVSGIGQVREDIWFTGDTNFFNDDVMRDLGRPFSNTYDMNDYIVEKWNRKVGKNDIVYHLGNFGDAEKKELSKLISRLNGRINLIVGATDKNENILSLRNKLASVNYRLDFRIDNWRITLNSYPQRFWKDQHKGSVHLHSYTCGTVPSDQYSLCLDVGVDTTNDLAPYNWEEIKELMQLKSEYIEFQKRRFAIGI